jgi:hypothetical protein
MNVPVRSRQAVVDARGVHPIPEITEERQR